MSYSRFDLRHSKIPRSLSMKSRIATVRSPEPNLEARWLKKKHTEKSRKQDKTKTTSKNTQQICMHTQT